MKCTLGFQDPVIKVGAMGAPDGAAGSMDSLVSCQAVGLSRSISGSPS